jgi:hypothetical protein
MLQVNGLFQRLRRPDDGALAGHEYKGVHVDKGAKAHLGDAYHIGILVFTPVIISAD